MSLLLDTEEFGIARRWIGILLQSSGHQFRISSRPAGPLPKLGRSPRIANSVMTARARVWQASGAGVATRPGSELRRDGARTSTFGLCADSCAARTCHAIQIGPHRAFVKANRFADRKVARLHRRFATEHLAGTWSRPWTGRRDLLPAPSISINDLFSSDMLLTPCHLEPKPLRTTTSCSPSADAASPTAVVRSCRLDRGRRRRANYLPISMTSVAIYHLSRLG